MMDIEMTSPVGPMISTGFDETRALGYPGYATEVDLCNLLQSMTLSKGKNKKGSRTGNNTLCPICLAKCKRARCRHGGLGVPLRRIGVIKLKLQLLRPTPYRSTHHLTNHPCFPTPSMPLPSVHSRFPRPRVPRALSVPLPVSRCISFPDDERRLPRHDLDSSQSPKRIPSGPQRVRRGSTGDR